MKFTPNPETLPPIGDLINNLALNPDIVQTIIRQFVDNSPIPELANLVLADEESD